MAALELEGNKLNHLYETRWTGGRRIKCNVNNPVDRYRVADDATITHEYAGTIIVLTLYSIRYS